MPALLVLLARAAGIEPRAANRLTEAVGAQTRDVFTRHCHSGCARQPCCGDVSDGNGVVGASIFVPELPELCSSRVASLLDTHHYRKRMRVRGSSLPRGIRGILCLLLPFLPAEPVGAAHLSLTPSRRSPFSYLVLHRSSEGCRTWHAAHFQ